MEPSVFEQLIRDNNVYVRQGDGYRRPMGGDENCTLYYHNHDGSFSVIVRGTGDATTRTAAGLNAEATIQKVASAWDFGCGCFVGYCIVITIITVVYFIVEAMVGSRP